MIYYILCFLTASIKQNVKVVPNDIFKFSGERVKKVLTSQIKQVYTQMQISCHSLAHFLIIYILYVKSLISESPVELLINLPLKRSNEFNCIQGFLEANVSEAWLDILLLGKHSVLRLACDFFFLTFIFHIFETVITVNFINPTVF